MLKGVKYLELSHGDLPRAIWTPGRRRRASRSGRAISFSSGPAGGPGAPRRAPWDTEVAAAGMHASCARWFHQRDVAIVGSDTHGELMPSPVQGVPFPMHQLLLIAMGTPMFDNCDLEPLSQAAAARKRWEFLLTAAPLAVPKGTGSPANPDRDLLTLIGGSVMRRLLLVLPSASRAPPSCFPSPEPEEWTGFSAR